MSKIRIVPVLNCSLPDGGRHGVVVHHSESYKPLGIGNSKKPTREDNQPCLHKPEGGDANFHFSLDDALAEEFDGIKIICQEVSCPFNGRERK